jgi:hypothetical protein
MPANFWSPRTKPKVTAFSVFRHSAAELAGVKTSQEVVHLGSLRKGIVNKKPAVFFIDKVWVV